ncbi:hypothetical protein ACWEPM_28925 [Streptomyces sp. NPDC004244]
MTARVRGAAALAALAAGAALLLTGCGGGAESAPAGQSVSGADSGQVAEMRQKLDAAEQAASDADKDAADDDK